MNKVFVFLYSFFVVILITACQPNIPPNVNEISSSEIIETRKNLKYGFDLDLYKVVKKKIRRGDTFGSILENHGISRTTPYLVFNRQPCKTRAVHHDPRTQYRSNRTEYRTDRTENRKNLQTAEKS